MTAKELDRNFKIPKKKPVSEEIPSVSQQQVMENSYYNYIPEPQPPVITPFQIDAARNLILESLQKREYERPKTYKNHICK